MGLSGVVNDKYLEYDKIARGKRGNWHQCKEFYPEAFEDKQALANLQEGINCCNILNASHPGTLEQKMAINTITNKDVSALSNVSKECSTQQ